MADRRLGLIRRPAALLPGDGATPFRYGDDGDGSPSGREVAG